VETSRSKRGELRWAEENRASALTWREDATRNEHFIEKCSSCGVIIAQCRCRGPHVTRYGTCEKCAGKRAVRTAPSEPYPTDEYRATDRRLWKACLDVASGERREFTESGRTIHSPNDGRGYRNMPANPNGIAWAVKQYNGFGGAWKPHREALEHLAQLVIMAHGGVVQTPTGKLEPLEKQGLVKLAGQGRSGDFWDITPTGRRVVQAILDPGRRCKEGR
jgi:hypothetical protein